MDEDKILAAIGFTEPSSFNEFCRSYDDCPAKGDTAGWREVFATLEYLEHQGLIKIDRAGKKIDTMILTEEGASRIRAKLDAKRGLFQELP